MIAFPFCKINLGLHVVNKREDGFHNIETCFYPVPWKDVLEIIPSQENKVFLTGNEMPGNPNSNIVLKAYEFLKKDFDIGPVEIYLHKIIPHGAGLGGGSSDGAHALELLNQLFNLNLSKVKLAEYALQLGSDCPFFLEASPMMATGRGEVLHLVAMSLKGLNLVIVKPPVQVSTAEAYAGITPRFPSVSLLSILNEPITKWKDLLKNDFEEFVFGKHPTIKEIKTRLYQLGALYASMSGSGSAVYGLFESAIDVKKEFSEMMCWSGMLGTSTERLQSRRLDIF